MGISLFRRKSRLQPPQATAAPPAAPPVKTSADSFERKTANDWAKKFQVNEVQAERAAMRAGRWHDLFTEEEFLELIKKQDA